MFFAWRRTALAITEMPVGLPTYRDPDALCPGYSPRKRKLEDWADCETNGHYLCSKCCLRKDTEEASPNGEPLSSPQQAEGYPAEGK